MSAHSATLCPHSKDHIQTLLHWPSALSPMRVAMLSTRPKRMTEYAEGRPKTGRAGTVMGSTGVELNKSQMSHELSFLCPSIHVWEPLF